MKNDDERLMRIATHHSQIIWDDWKDRTGGTKNLVLAMSRPDRLLAWRTVYNSPAENKQNLEEGELHKKFYLGIKDYFTLQMFWAIGGFKDDFLASDIKRLLFFTLDDIDFEKVAGVIASVIEIINAEFEEGKDWKE